MSDLAALTDDFRLLDEAESHHYYAKCRQLQAIRDWHRDHYAGREASALFAAHRAEHLSLGQSPASKMLSVADHVSENAGTAGLPASYLYYLARANKRDPEHADDYELDAVTMPMQDFLEHHGLVTARKQKATRLVCPHCGAVAPKDDFEEAS